LADGERGVRSGNCGIYPFLKASNCQQNVVHNSTKKLWKKPTAQIIGIPTFLKRRIYLSTGYPQIFHSNSITIFEPPWRKFPYLKKVHKKLFFGKEKEIYINNFGLFASNFTFMKKPPGIWPNGFCATFICSIISN